MLVNIQVKCYILMFCFQFQLQIFNFYFLYVVTRSKSKLFKRFKIKNCYIKLDIGFQSVTLDWLEQTRPIVQNEKANAANAADENENALNENAGSVLVQIEASQENALPERIVRRRGTFAGGSLQYDVGNQTREFGSDFLPKYRTYRLVQCETENKIECNKPANHIEVEADVGNDEIIQVIESVDQVLKAASSQRFTQA